MAVRGGASAVTALGMAPVETLNTFIETCERYGIDAMIDMMNVEYPLAVLQKLKKIPPIIIIHRGVDEEKLNKEKQSSFAFVPTGSPTPTVTPTEVTLPEVPAEAFKIVTKTPLPTATLSVTNTPDGTATEVPATPTATLEPAPTATADDKINISHMLSPRTTPSINTPATMTRAIKNIYKDICFTAV